MTKVFISMAMSLDGYIAPFERADDPNGEQWMKKWSKLQNWAFKQQFFRDNLKLGGKGDTGRINQLMEETFNRTGVSIMGKRMFDAGEVGWPEEAPFHTPVFVVTHQVREPWERPGGTTFYFVNDGIHSALEEARKVAGGRDIRIAGGGNLARQYIKAGLVDEINISLSPVFLGEGIRLFEGIDTDKVQLEIVDVAHAPYVTHLQYAVTNR